jgi:biopolymer transport protein ExbB
MLFYKKHKADAQALRQLVISLDGGNIDAAVTTLKAGAPGMEVNVLSYGLQQLDKGGRAVEELMNGALVREIERYDKSLWYLATLGNNAPFIGLFGTVLGVIMAFDAMGQGGGDQAAVMGPIAEALIATGVGLIVAIPAVVAFNIFKQNVKAARTNTELLTRTLVAHMFSEEDK